MSSWVGFDFDGTLARRTPSMHKLGSPIWKMVHLLKQYLEEGCECKIVTARVAPPHTEDERVEQHRLITQWLKFYIGKELPIIYWKDRDMALLYDDRAVGVETDTGRIYNAIED